MWCEPSPEYLPWKANNHLLGEYPLTQPDSLVSSKMIIIVWLMESQIYPFFLIILVQLLQVEQFVTHPDQIRATYHIHIQQSSWLVNKWRIPNNENNIFEYLIFKTCIFLNIDIFRTKFIYHPTNFLHSYVTHFFSIFTISCKSCMVVNN